MVAGGWLSGFSFVAPFVPSYSLGPCSILVLIWLAIIAHQNGVDARKGTSAVPE